MYQMNDKSFSQIEVGPHPATYIPPPFPKKKGYVAPGQRDPNTAEIKLDARNFPSLGQKVTGSPTLQQKVTGSPTLQQKVTGSPTLQQKVTGSPTLGQSFEENATARPTVMVKQMNFLTTIKEAELKREEDSIYDAEKIASMNINQLKKEGWMTVKKSGSSTDIPLLPLKQGSPSPNITDKPTFPFPPDLQRRRVITKKASYTDLYDIEYDDTETGAMALAIDEDDGESSV